MDRDTAGGQGGTAADRGYDVRDGLVSFGGELAGVFALLEARFERLARSFAAEPMIAAPLIRVEDLKRIDYFENFPHLGTWVSLLRPERLDAYAAEGAPAALPAVDLGDARYGLPSSACYNVYVYFRDSVVAPARIVTLTARCFRGETRYHDLERLWGFHMRELVCLGRAEAVRAFLRDGKARLAEITAACGLAVDIETAHDPFFSADNPRLAMQRAFPTKEEFQYGEGALGIASVNYHRNFFGERFAIRDGDGEVVHTGCIGMGLERWIAALLDRYQGDVGAIRGVLEAMA